MINAQRINNSLYCLFITLMVWGYEKIQAHEGYASMFRQFVLARADINVDKYYFFFFDRSGFASEIICQKVGMGQVKKNIYS